MSQISLSQPVAFFLVPSFNTLRFEQHHQWGDGGNRSLTFSLCNLRSLLEAPDAPSPQNLRDN